MTQRHVDVYVTVTCVNLLRPSSIRVVAAHFLGMMSPMDIQQSDQMTIRQMCEMFEVTPRTLRFYEAKELLSPLRSGQKRLYGKRERARLKLILRGKKFGCSLEVIRQILDLYDLGDQALTQMERSYALGEERLRALEAQRDELIETIDELKDYLSWGQELIAKTRLKNAG